MSFMLHPFRKLIGRLGLWNDFLFESVTVCNRLFVEILFQTLVDAALKFVVGVLLGIQCSCLDIGVGFVLYLIQDVGLNLLLGPG